MEGVFDVAVIGAGIEGSAIAHALSSYNVRTVLIEQFPLPHTRGSSHGHSRGIRAAYGEKDFMTKMMIDAYEMWRDIEVQADKTIFKKTGLIYLSNDKQAVDVTIQCMARHGISSASMSEEEVVKKWPGFRMPRGCYYALDKTAGALRASVALKSFQELFCRNGGIIIDAAPVSNVIPGDNIVTLETSRGRIEARKVCFAAGPWTNKLLAGTGLTLRLQVQRISALYWKLKKGKNMDGHPNFIFSDGDEENKVYSVMGDEYPGHVKVCPDSGSVVDPDLRDQTPPDTKTIGVVQEFVAKHLPHLDASGPSIVETCMYTRTPDDDYILDRHPRYDNMFISAGFSGHGFKMAPIVGRIMADMITDKKAKYDASPFRIGRFAN